MCVHHLRYVMAVSYEKTEHFLKSLIAHWCGLHLGLYVSLPPERTLARRSKALYNDQKKMTRPDHSVWNHCHTLLQAGLLDMTTLNSYPCVKSLLEVLLICSEKKKFIENRRRSQQWELPWCYRYRGVWIFEHLRDEQYIIIYLFVPLHTLQWLNESLNGAIVQFPLMTSVFEMLFTWPIPSDSRLFRHRVLSKLACCLSYQRNIGGRWAMCQ